MRGIRSSAIAVTPGRGERGREIVAPEGREQPQHDGAAALEREIVGSRRCDARDDAGARVQRRRVSRDLRAGVREALVVEAGAHARGALDEDADLRCGQTLDGVRRQRDAGFPRGALMWNADDDRGGLHRRVTIQVRTCRGRKLASFPLPGQSCSRYG